jgi:S1-C subfamily serine protease
MKLKSTLVIFSLFLLTSCGIANPNKLSLDASKKEEVVSNLTSILDSTGKVTDEDINVQVYKAVSDAVVGIQTTSLERKVFNFSYVKGTGSGVIISKQGHILTNYHVVANAKKIDVALGEDTKLSAKFILGDKDNDIAIIKLDKIPDNMVVASLGDSQYLSVGQKVLAIGSPFGLNGTLTTGIISSLNRTLPAEDGTVLSGIIQTDAAINPGNSGGPLINSKGEIIGINTAIFSPNGGNVGIGFAIPVNKIKDFLNSKVQVQS